MELTPVMALSTVWVLALNVPAMVTRLSRTRRICASRAVMASAPC